MQKPMTQDDPMTGRPSFAPPPGLANPRNGTQIGLDGDRDPLRLGAGGIDIAPNGVRPEPQPGTGTP